MARDLNTPPHPRQPAWLACDGNERFSSPQVVAKVLKRRNLKRRKYGGKLERPLNHYRCEHCGFFHIGGFGKRR